MKLTSKTWALIAVIAIVLIGGGLLYKMNNTPAKKVEQLEKQVTDIKETSGYNACVAKLDEQMKVKKDCTVAKLAEKGYTDGIDCIADYNNPICKDTARYNAEVYGGNDCIPIAQKVTPLTMVDCLKLLENK